MIETNDLILRQNIVLKHFCSTAFMHRSHSMIMYYIGERSYEKDCCSVAKCFSTFTYSDTGVFYDFYIEPVFRKKGVDRKLAQAAQEWCKENGIASLTVCCAPCDVGMYQSLGFHNRLGSTYSKTT